MKSPRDKPLCALRACLKTRPVRAPGLQEWPNWTIYCRPGALTRLFGRVFKQALREQTNSI
jgi:hypothetical protein